MPIAKAFSLVLLVSLPFGDLLAADPAPGRRADQEALKAYAPLVGPWKGVGQVQRGVSRGAWIETADWAWKLSTDSAALELSIGQGKFLKAARLGPGPRPGTFAMTAMLTDGSTRRFVGQAADRDRLALTAEGDGGGGVRRITVTPLHETRFLLLLEAQDPTGGAFTRLGEVGYTRQGVAFAAGDSFPVCIVTGGRGTMTVQHKGRTYHVCCSGCKDLFESDPEGVLADAREREKAGK